MTSAVTAKTPQEIHTDWIKWDFSFKATHMRNTNGREKRFRWRDKEGGEWDCHRIAGTVFYHGDLTAELGVKGHLDIWARVKIKNGVAQVAPPPLEALPVYDYVKREALEDGHYRLCGNLGVNPGEEDKPPWRLRDENHPYPSEGDGFNYVFGYYGVGKMDWKEDGPHVFHDGPVEIDTDGYAHLLLA